MKYGEWQPIETAPKDGTHILAYPALLDEPAIVAWYEGINGGKFWRILMTRTAAPYSPAHWMPLPPAPEAE